MTYAAETKVPVERSKAEIPTAVDLSWIAGLFEGEGTVAITGGGKRPYTRMIVCVSSTDIDTLAPFDKFFPVPSIHRSKINNPRAKQAWTWRMSSRKAASFLATIRPFVRTDRVLKKIDLALKAQGERIQGTRQNCAAYREKHADYKAQMHVLNRRGNGS